MNNNMVKVRVRKMNSAESQTVEIFDGLRSREKFLSECVLAGKQPVIEVTVKPFGGQWLTFYFDWAAFTRIRTSTEKGDWIPVNAAALKKYAADEPGVTLGV